MSEGTKKEAGGESAAPWIITFADMSSLLMSFFVMMLSFSELSLNKYKQMAGSMKEAFGVQREIKVMDMPKGTSIVAHEFSPGRPSPSVLNVMRQDTFDESKQTLYFTDALTKKNSGDDTDDGNIGYTLNRPVGLAQTASYDGNDPKAGGMYPEDKDAGSVLSDTQNENTDGDQAARQDVIAKAMEAGEFDPDTLQKQIEAAKAQERKEEKTRINANAIMEDFKQEIKRGMVQVETTGTKILIRIREKGSFPSGSDSFQEGFLPALTKLRDTLASVSGKVIVAGHTDNVPINTARFRSNWELSASRAVSVVHELLKDNKLSPDRFLVEGHGDAHPLAPNDTAENRALNRRVELTIEQGDDNDEDHTREFEDMVNNALNKTAEVTEIPAAASQTTPAATMAEAQSPIPEVSVEHLEPVPVQPAAVPEPPVQAPPAAKTEPAPQASQDKVDANSIEARLRSFYKKMEKHKD